MRGPSEIAGVDSSSYVSTSVVSGLRIARRGHAVREVRAYDHDSPGGSPAARRRCACVSTKPGMIVLPRDVDRCARR